MAAPISNTRRRVQQGLALFIGCALLGVGWACHLIRQPVWRLNPPSTAVVAPERLRTHVEFLAVECHPRHYLARDNQRKAAAYIAERCREAGARVVAQEIHTPAGRYENVLAHFGPAQGPRFVVGAHYDSCGVQAGADDNASGVAGLIELAGLLGREPILPAHFELAAYNLEEPPFFKTPLMGSAVHARSLSLEGAQVALMISLEMIGFFRDEPGTQSYPAPWLHWILPSRGNFIALVGRWDQRQALGAFKRACAGTAGVPIVSLAAPTATPQLDFSDHRSFWEAGYPAIMVTDTALSRNPNYHRATDLPPTLDYHRMAEVVRMVHAGLMRMATAPPSPSANPSRRTPSPTP